MPWPSVDGWPADALERDRRLGEILRLTRELLDADVTTLDEVTDEHETVMFAAGEWAGAGSLQGVSAPRQDTICQRMLEGRIENVVGDVRADEELAALPMVRTLDIGAWLGVPIALPDARLYVLCCLNRESRPSLGVREVKLLAGLAESVRAELLAQAPSD